MEIVFFIIWGLCTLWCFLIIPIGNKIEKFDDNNRLKKWWRKHIISDGPNEKDSI
jgi:hypothetical protein